MKSVIETGIWNIFYPIGESQFSITTNNKDIGPLYKDTYWVDEESSTTSCMTASADAAVVIVSHKNLLKKMQSESLLSGKGFVIPDTENL